MPAGSILDLVTAQFVTATARGGRTYVGFPLNVEAHPNHFLEIMEAVRGRELEAFDRSIDVHMGRIRAAIEADPKNPKRILTVRGVGYVFAKQQD